MVLTALAVALVSAATLTLEIALTRVFSVTQGYHFAFLAVSLALLGFGASGSVLTAWQSRSPATLHHPAPGPWLWAALFALTGLVCYLATNYLPFDSYRLGLDPWQIPMAVLYYLFLAVPFFFSGLMMAHLLALFPEKVGSLYAANLAGSGFGCLLAVAALPLIEGRGIVPLIALMGAMGAALQAHVGGFLLQGTTHRPNLLARRLLPPAIALVAAALLLLRPAFLEPQLSPYKGLSTVLLFPDTRLLSTRWNVFSRVDVVQSSALRSAPGLSLRYKGPLPAQAGVTVDGNNLRGLITAPQAAEFVAYLPTAIAYRLLNRPNVLILEPGGGLDVLAALRLGAKSITAVEANPLLVEAVQRYDAGLYSEPEVSVVIESGRSYLRRTTERYDLIHFSLADAFHPVLAGAYSLAENYLYTVEAFQEACDHLTPGGIFMIPRWLQMPPSDDLRAVTIAVAALRAAGVADAAQHLAVLRSFQTMVLLVKRGAWTPEEIAIIRQFCQEQGFDLIYLPGLKAEEANRFNILQEDVYFQGVQRLLSPEAQRYLAEHPYDLSPPTDDRPFYFHTFKWQQLPLLLAGIGRTWQPFGGAGYLLLPALLVLVTVVSGIAILLPLLLARRTDAPWDVAADSTRGQSILRKCFFAYFFCLGLGYLFVEIPLMQHFILFLGQPTYAIAAVLGTLLLASGLGSMTVRDGNKGTGGQRSRGERGQGAKGMGETPLRSLSRHSQMMAILLTLIAVYPLLLPGIFHATLGHPLPVRVLVTVALLFPPGFLMGRPFPSGITLVRHRAAWLIPWVWAVNGFASVVASVLAAILAASWGFSWVLWTGAIAYGCALAAWLIAERIF